MDRSLLIASVVAIAAIGLAAIAWPDPPDPPPLQLSSSQERQVTIHVSGAVSRPGLVVLDGGARVADAIAAAGGATPEAQLEALNLAAPVTDGSRIAVPGEGVDAVAVIDGSVRVNTAPASDLEGLPGVGPVLAERIVQYRNSNGPFGSVEDLLDVPGIGESKLDAMRDAVIVP